jgi:hypothetical protein
MKSTRNTVIAAVLLCAVALTLVSLTTARAISLGQILKVGGIAFLVDKYDRPINDFINKNLGERQAAAQGATKVVPILSLGSGGYVGAAQVVGVPSAVQATKFVIQVESRIVGSLRGTLLVPTGKKPEGGSVDRMKGVGVSAIVEFEI